MAYAEQAKARLLLENLNFEPDDAEIHYLAHNVDECRYYFEAISSAHFGWAFTVNHANLVPEGINGFIDAFGIGRIGEVRLADNLGDKEVHLNPGEGNIDFASLFTRLESAGYQDHYMMAFGNQADKLAARDFFEQYSRGLCKARVRTCNTSRGQEPADDHNLWRSTACAYSRRSAP